MRENRALKALKGAILLERRGKTLYDHFAESVENESVRGIFATMAEEEALHIKILGQHMRELHKNGRLADTEPLEEPPDIKAEVITKDVVDNISASSNEAAAISSAIALEEKAVNYYSKMEMEADDDDIERELYRWLANWERGHLQFLAEIDRELTDQVWADNQFWPLY